MTTLPDTTQVLANVRRMTPVVRRKVRQYRPSQWQYLGLQLPPDGGKYRQYYITHTDLFEWAGGLEAVQERCVTVREAIDYLWMYVYERQVPFIKRYFDTVEPPNDKRLTEYLREHFEDSDDLTQFNFRRSCELSNIASANDVVNALDDLGAISDQSGTAVIIDAGGEEVVSLSLSDMRKDVLFALAGVWMARHNLHDAEVVFFPRKRSLSILLKG